MARMRATSAAPAAGRALLVARRAMLLLVLVTPLVAHATGSNTSPTTVTDPSAYVDPFIGTGSGGANVGQIDTFPGPSVPFGMIQWSPDTTSRPDGGGYNYDDTTITGFSLTHLSGTGCPIFGDVPFLPVPGSVPSNPSSASAPFSHDSEVASPGRYAVTLNTRGGPISVELSTTTRTGMGSFSFPTSTTGTMSPLTLLINTSGSANLLGNNSIGTVEVVSPTEVVGSTLNGAFCIARNTYQLYFAAGFSQPATSSGTWVGPVTSPAPACAGPQCGAYMTFAPSASPLLVKVGISYVSIEGALANLRAEDPDFDLSSVESAAAHAWRSLLGRVIVSGGTPAQLTSFYTALYHAFLDPTTFSDVDGRYPTFTNTAMVASGISRTSRVQYANFSMWDTYRTQMPLVALIDPSQASDMVTSLLNDAAQGGWLPRWPVANSYTGTQSGDSADPLIASAYAFGARSFGTDEALRAMVHGAEDPAPLSTVEDVMFESDSLIRYEERPGLPAYDRLHYVPNFMFRQSSGVPDGASTTLEYATDDAAIGFFARSLGRRDVASRFLTRAQNWKYMFNAATGYAEPRGASGSFPAGVPVQPPPPQKPPYPADQIYFGQNGFQEGNAAQYTWMVPFDIAGLINALGGRDAASSRLDAFFDRNVDPYGFGQAGPNAPYFWAGNEPDMQTPWLYDFTGEPWKTQELVREIEDAFYTPTPGGEPGNDDLGTMAAWYVWAALGLYPVIPGDGTVVLGSPLFPRVEIEVPGEGTLDIEAPAASDSSPYVQAVALNGQPVNVSWLSVGALMPGATGGAPARTVLSFDLDASPSTTWASDPADAPPSYGVASAPGIGGATAIGFSAPWGQLVVAPGTPTQLEIGARNVSGLAQTVHWQALAPPGVSVSPARGVIDLAGGPTSASEMASVSVVPGGICQHLTLDFSTARGQPLPGVVIALSPSSDVECGAPSELGGSGESLGTAIESIPQFP